MQCPFRYFSIVGEGSARKDYYLYQHMIIFVNISLIIFEIQLVIALIIMIVDVMCAMVSRCYCKPGNIG